MPGASERVVWTGGDATPDRIGVVDWTGMVGAAVPVKPFWAALEAQVKASGLYEDEDSAEDDESPTGAREGSGEEPSSRPGTREGSDRERDQVTNTRCGWAKGPEQDQAPGGHLTILPEWKWKGQNLSLIHI